MEGASRAIPQVLLLNVVALNGGDAAIMTAIADQVAQACGAEHVLVAADRHAAVCRKYYPGPRFVAPAAGAVRARRRGLRWLNRLHGARLMMGTRLLRSRPGGLARLLLRGDELSALRTYARSSIAVATGGSYVSERYGDLQMRLLEMRLALALGLPLVLFTQSVERLTTPRHRRALRAVLAGAEAVFLRDEASRHNLEDLASPSTRMEVVGDAAFLLGPPAGSASAAARDTPGGRLAVSVREWPYATKEARCGYREGMARFLDEAVGEHGCEVTMLSTCQGIPEYWTDDAREADAILRLVPDLAARVTVDRAFHRPDELVAKLAGFDWVVATRMHVAILALVAGVPVLPVSYEFKTKELFEELGLGAYVTAYEDVGSGAVARSFDALRSERETWEERLWRNVDLQRESAARSGRALRAAIGAARAPS
jgi:colanic acid/amylovoran biosynthesis protein